MPTDRLVLAVSLLLAAAAAWGLRVLGLFDMLVLVGARPRGRSGGFGRDVSGLPASVWFVCAAMVFLSLIFGPSIAVLLPARFAGAPSEPRFAAIAALCSFGLAAAVAGPALWMIRPAAGPESGTRPAWSDLIPALVCAAAIAPFYLATAVGTEMFVRGVLHRELPPLAHDMLTPFVAAPLSSTGIVIAFTAVVLVPIAEECIYRVFLTSSLLRLAGRSAAGEGKRLSPPRVFACVLVTSAIFAASHAAFSGPVPWAAVPGLFVLSVGLGLAYERTGRLGVPIIVHGLFNLTNLVVAGLLIGEPRP